MQVIISGGGTGIGRALTLAFVKKGYKVGIIGRRIEPLEELRKESPQNIFTLCGDVSKKEDRARILREIRDSGFKPQYVIHNAAIIEPVCQIENITEEDYRRQHAINAEGPLFFTQGIIPLLAANARIMFILSDAATNAYPGLCGYGMSKAALKMLCRSFQAEVTPVRHIYFTGLFPGGVHTPIADTLASYSPRLFPMSHQVKESIQKGEMLSPAESADFIQFVLTETTNEAFVKEWDIENEDSKSLWQRHVAEMSSTTLEKK